ncbi:MAG: DNA-binding response regulator [Candidatus Accumulibacter sp. 66-26]|nr:DNA-binding response regulator [Accumulibacter sp.]MBN9423221.1 response regulator transcription factor [Accumulibacter sp.]OJW49213.1 MAG: DNA-binding response regulator [Candidatus Accumulibacter sp. 66-26]
MLKLLVVEDHALVREGLVQTLRQLENDVVIHEAADCDGAGALLERERDFDLVLLDLGLPGVDGLCCLGIFRQRYPAVPIVIVSAYDDAHTVNRALKNGASGFVPKAYSSDRLIAALREVLDGRIYTPEQMMPVNLGADLAHPPIGGEADPSEFGLTERQSEVLALMTRGKSNRDIAEQLGLSEGTVKIHITAIFKALGVSSRTQALVAVARYGIKL